jgi:positive regulator of sigma E activity
MNGIPSIRQNSLVAAVAFTLVLLVGYLADVVLFRHPSWMLVDEVILAVAAGLVVFRYERERSRFLAEKLRVTKPVTEKIKRSA